MTERNSLSPEAIAEFQELYKEQYGKEISKEEASREGIRLLRLFREIYKPMTF